MPRQPRLDAPGLLQHVMARGIERREIFKDDKDRKSFLDRLAVILEETQTQCYAWSLIPNHFHLLLRTGLTPLSKVMRRLMTGYAVTFNKRHKRSGHLFQNRYKSIVCEEDPYLLELIRYIHLNPLRAGVVKDLMELDKYPWCGHSAILGKRKNPLIPQPPKQPNRFTPLNCSKGAPTGIQRGPDRPNRPEKALAEKTVEDVLLHFGDTKSASRRTYREFVKKGIDQGKRSELQGGGFVRPACHARSMGILRNDKVDMEYSTSKRQPGVKARAGRSAGSNKAGLLGRKKEERDPPASPERAQARGGGLGKGDERILGSGDFVIQALNRANELFERSVKNPISLDELITRVTKDRKVDLEDLLSSKRTQEISNTRAIISYLAAIELRNSGTSIASQLRLSEKSVSRCLPRRAP